MSKKRKRPAKSEFKLSPRVEGILHKAVLLADINGNFKFSGEDLIRSTMECGLSVLPAAMLMEGVQISEFYAKYYENYNINCAALTAEQRAEKFKKDIAEYLKPGNEDNPLCRMEVDALDIIEGANEWAAALGNDVICSQHIILAILDKEDTQLYKTLRNLGVSYNVEKIIDGVFDTTVSVDTRDFTKESIVKIPLAGEISNSTTVMKPKKIEKVPKKVVGVEEEDVLACLDREERAVIDKVCVDMTETAKKFSPIIGRDAELKVIMQTLMRKSKCAPVLVGEAGVGKTAAVTLLMQKVLLNEVPDELLGIKIIELSLNSLLAGTKFRGEAEERCEKLISAMKKLSRKVIFFIDEVHVLADLGSNVEGASGLANSFKPIMADPHTPVMIIAATTKKEFKILEKDPALMRRFSRVDVEEPNKENSMKIIEGILPYYAKYHKLDFEDGLTEEIYKQAKTLGANRHMPDSACDVIDLSMANCKINKIKKLTKEIIEDTVKDMSGRIKKKGIGFSEN